MSHIQKDQEQLNKEEVFRTGSHSDLTGEINTDLNAPQIMRVKNSTDIINQSLSEEDDKDMAKTSINLQRAANEEYLERILAHSANKNLAMRARQEKDLKADNWKKAPKKFKFMQQLPTAVKGWFFGFFSKENKAVKTARRTFDNADLNTIREQPALEAFLNGKEFARGVVPEEASDKDLKAYVDYIIKNAIDSRYLTDDYLSNHITQVYEYTWKLSEYNRLKSQHPDFFASLPETKKIALEQIAATSSDLSELLQAHFSLHGIDLRTGADDKFHAFIKKKTYGSKAERAQARQTLQNKYNKKLTGYLKKAFVNKEYVLAEQFTENEFINESQDLLKSLNSMFAEGTEAAQLYGTEAQTAIEEIRKTLALRDQLVEDQKNNLAAGDAGGADNDAAARAIKNTNAKLLLCSEHIDNYKEYLSYLSGKTDKLDKKTTAFLAAEEHQDLLEPVRFRERLSEAGYSGMTFDQLKLRRKLTAYKKHSGEVLSKSQEAEFKKAFGDRTDGAADLTAFKQTLHFVERDAKGSVLQKDQEKDRQNRQDISDYIAGGAKRQEYLKRKVKEILSFNITGITLTPGYITTHYDQLYEMNRIMQGFSKIADEYAGFLESDAFTEEERDAFRVNYTENPLIPVLGQLLESYAGAVGMKPDGDELLLPDLKNKDKSALIEYQADRQRQSLATADALFETVVPDSLMAYKEFDQLSSKKPEMVRHVGEFYARLKSKCYTVAERSREYTAKMTPLQAEQQRLSQLMSGEKDKKKAEDYRAEYRRVSKEVGKLEKDYTDARGNAVAEWNSYLPLAREMKEYLYGKTDKISDEALCFAVNNGFGGYFSNEDIDGAAFRVEKKKLMNKLGYPFAKNADNKASEKNEKDLRNSLGIAQDADIEEAINDMAQVGVTVQDTIFARSSALTPDQQREFEKHFGGSVVNNEDVRCFCMLCEPVKRDIFGNPLPGYEKNAEINARLLEDYLSGDQERVNSVLKRMGDMILNIDISKEKITEEYFLNNCRERSDSLTVLFSFQNYYKFKLDYFTSDAFSPAQQIDLMKKMNTQSAMNATGLVATYIDKRGYYSTNGRPVEPMKDANRASQVQDYRRKLETALFTQQVVSGEYQEALAAEERVETKERNEQLRLFNRASGTELKLGHSNLLYRRIQDISEGREKGLEEGTREEFKAVLGKTEEVKAVAAKRDTSDVPKDGLATLEDVKAERPKLDDEAARKVLKLRLRIENNTQRILASDKLFQTFAQAEEEGRRVNVDELRGEIKAFTDRLLSLKLDETTLNEEYMIENIDLFLELNRAHYLLPHIRKYYPEILDSLPAKDKAAIWFMNKNQEKLNSLIVALLDKYNVEYSSDSYQIGAVNTFSELEYFKYIETTAEAKNAVQLKEKKQGTLDGLLREVREASAEEGHLGYSTARLLTENLDSEKGNAFSSRVFDPEAIEDSLKKNKKLYESCKPYYDRILAEYRKDASDTEHFFHETKALLDAEDGNEARIEEAGKKMIRMQADLERYHELFRLASGEGSAVSEETERFLKKKGLTMDYGMILVNIVLDKTENKDGAEGEAAEKKSEEKKEGQVSG